MAKKRGQNEGSIILRKDGRYEVRISVDSRQRTVGYAWTADEAQQKKTAALRDRDRGMPFISDNTTLAHTNSAVYCGKPGCHASASTICGTPLRRSSASTGQSTT